MLVLNNLPDCGLLTNALTTCSADKFQTVPKAQVARLYLTPSSQ